VAIKTECRSRRPHSEREAAAQAEDPQNESFAGFKEERP
jgi:hypothetical protein